MKRMTDIKIEQKKDEVIINDGLAINKNGDVTIGKNLTVDGEITNLDREVIPISYNNAASWGVTPADSLADWNLNLYKTGKTISIQISGDISCAAKTETDIFTLTDNSKFRYLFQLDYFTTTYYDPDNDNIIQVWFNFEEGRITVTPQKAMVGDTCWICATMVS